MGNPGAAKDLPLHGGDATLITNHERNQNAGIRRIAERADKALAHRFAQPMHPIHGPAQSVIQALGATAHMAGRAHATLEQPRLVVKTTRVVQAMRPLQAHDETPALPRPDAGQRRR